MDCTTFAAPSGLLASALILAIVCLIVGAATTAVVTEKRTVRAKESVFIFIPCFRFRPGCRMLFSKKTRRLSAASMNSQDSPSTFHAGVLSLRHGAARQKAGGAWL